METGVARFTVCQPLAEVLVKVAVASLVPVAVHRSSDVLAGVVGAAVELEGGNITGDVRLELDADLELLTVVEVGLGRCAGGAEQAVGHGRRRRHGDVEGLAGGEAAEVGRRHPDAERAGIGRRRRAAEGPRRGVEAQPGGKRRAVGGRLPRR